MNRDRRIMTALIGRNLHHHARLTLTLVVGFALFEGLLVQLIAFIEGGTGLRDLIALLPQAFSDFIGAQLAVAPFAATMGFGFQHPLVFVGAVGLVMVLSTIPAGERESGLLDLLLAGPMSRTQYLLGTLVPMIVAAALLPLALLVGLIAGQAVVDPPNAIPWTRYVMSAVGLFTLLLAVGGLTLLLATGAQRRGLAVARAVGVILTVYVAEVFADLRAGLDVLHWTSPFHYYDPIRSAVAGVTPARNFLILLGVFGVTTTLAFFLFERRDV